MTLTLPTQMPVLPPATVCPHCDRPVANLPAHLGPTAASSLCPELRRGWAMGEEFTDFYFDDDLYDLGVDDE